MSIENISTALAAVRVRGKEVLSVLLPLVYDELRAMAHRRLPPGGRDTVLDTTALVHEVYLKLADCSPLDWRDRQHFFAVAALAMRQIVVDHARARLTLKRGGGFKRVEFDPSRIAFEEQSDNILILNDALSRLSMMNERHARIVELRFFAGLSIEDTAEVLEISTATVKREWRLARAYLLEVMSSGEVE